MISAKYITEITTKKATENLKSNKRKQGFNQNFNGEFTSIRLVNETCTVAFLQAGKQVNQFASTIDHAGSTTFYRKLHQQKLLFYLILLKETCYLIFVCVYQKVYQENIPFVKTIDIYVFIKGITRKINCYWHVCFFFDLY